MEATENAYCAWSVHCRLYHDHWKLSIKCNRLVNEALYNYALLIMCTVILSSSADSLCPGDGVVFTCVTDTGRLLWDIINSTNTLQQLFHSPAQLNKNILQAWTYSLSHCLTLLERVIIHIIQLLLQFMYQSPTMVQQLNAVDKLMLLVSISLKEPL